MLRALVTLSCVIGGSALQLGQQQLSRRGVFQFATAASASTTLLPQLAVAADKPDPKTVATLRDTSKALKSVLEQKDAFVKGLTESDPTAPGLPPGISFATFQKLEKAGGPDFMEAAIDYAEASRNARDLVKLAKLTTQPVEITTKEKGKPKVTEVKTYGEVRAARATRGRITHSDSHGRVARLVACSLHYPSLTITAGQRHARSDRDLRRAGCPGDSGSQPRPRGRTGGAAAIKWEQWRTRAQSMLIARHRSPCTSRCQPSCASCAPGEGGAQPLEAVQGALWYFECSSAAQTVLPSVH